MKDDDERSMMEIYDVLVSSSKKRKVIEENRQKWRNKSVKNNKLSVSTDNEIMYVRDQSSGIPNKPVKNVRSILKDFVE